MLIRHAFFRIFEGNTAYQLAGIGIAGNDSMLPAFRNSERFIPEQYTEARLLLHTTMTGNTFFIEDRFYLCTKINFFCRFKKVPCNSPSYQQEHNCYF